MLKNILTLPVTLFASTMGLGGTALVYGRLSSVLSLPESFFILLKWLDSAVFIIVALSFIYRLLKDRESVRQEFNHPLKINFFAGIPISMFLLSVLWQDIGFLSTVLYAAALVFITLFTLEVATLWFRRSLELRFLNPAWFIPVVGNVIAVFTAQENWPWLWYYFTVGTVFYLLLLGLILFRLIFAEPMPPAMKPSLFIFIAPPSFCFIDYVKLTGQFDSTALIFLSLTIFFALLILALWKDFLKVPFTPSWWAFTFPVAAVSAAMLTAFELTQQEVFLCATAAVFSALVILVTVTLVKTVTAVVKGTLE